MIYQKNIPNISIDFDKMIAFFQIYNISPITMNLELCARAKQWANILVTKKTFEYFFFPQIKIMRL